MEEMIQLNALEVWLLQWGSLALFFMLAVGIIALPVPEETLMVIAGALVRAEKLHLEATFIASLLGSICGITVSYYLGKGLGHYLIQRFGKWLHIGKSQVTKAHNWFERYGGWALFIGYFIPGVRHFTGFSAGVASLEYPKFAIFAYTGALFWVTTFLSIGYFFGGYCSKVCGLLEHRVDDILSIIVLLLALYGLYLTHKKPSSL